MAITGRSYKDVRKIHGRGSKGRVFRALRGQQFWFSAIEAEHLLLGTLRECKLVRDHLSPAAVEDIRTQIEQLSPRREQISTLVDIPVSGDCKHALSFAAEEASELGHRHIDLGHLVLGLLRVESTQAALILRQHGVILARFRELVRNSEPESRDAVRPQRILSVARMNAGDEAEVADIVAPALKETVSSLNHIIQRMASNLEPNSEAYALRRLKRTPWSRKEALGHLIDWATAHHQWFVRALVDSKLTATGYPKQEWVAAQQYGDVSWTEIVDTGTSMNCLISAVLARVPEEKTAAPCRIDSLNPFRSRN